MRANLVDADLKISDFSYANLTNANFKDADLEGANLSNANLTDVNFAGANLAYANLYGADLRFFDFTNANVKTAIFGNHIGIFLDIKSDLEKRGAIFPTHAPTLRIEDYLIDVRSLA